MKKVALLLAAGLAAVAAPAVAIEVAVTRFHTPATVAQAAPGPIAVRAAAGLGSGRLADQQWLNAVAAALTRAGYTVVADAPRVAEVTLDQQVIPGGAGRSGSGVSVGVGAGTSSGRGWYGGGWGGGVAVGIDLTSLFGKKKSNDTLASTLRVTIADAAGAHLWEGRAEATPRVGSKDAAPAALASEMADALIAGFPGESGATIAVR